VLSHMNIISAYLQVWIVHCEFQKLLNLKFQHPAARDCEECGDLLGLNLGRRQSSPANIHIKVNSRFDYCGELISLTNQRTQKNCAVLIECECD